MFTGPRNTSNGLIFSVDFGNVKSFSEDKSLINVSGWTIGTGSATDYTQNGNTVENERKVDTDPFGNDAIIWESIPEAASGSDGGWNTSQFSIDITKMYRFSVWVNRKVQGNGNFYLGTRGYGTTSGVDRLDTGVNSTNPYFWTSSNGTNMPIGEWMLVVGHVWPYGTTVGTTIHEDSGRYTITGGTYGSITRDFIWTSGNTTSLHRSYLYYSTNTGTTQQWSTPRVDIVDGTEPTLEELLENRPNKAVDLTNHQNNVYVINNCTYESADYGSINTNATTIQDKGYIGCDDIIFQDEEPYSLEFIVKLRSGAGTTFHSLVGRGSSTPWVSLNGSATNWRFSFRELDSTYHYSSYKTDYNITDNWLHVVLTVDSGRVAKVYYNGELFETLSTPTSSYMEINRIASGYDSGGNFYSLQGNMAIAKIYDKTLSSSDVEQNYDSIKSRFGLS